MVFHKHIPDFPLNSYVDCIIYIEGNNKGVGFPKIAMNLVFNLNDSFKLYADSSFTDFIDYKKYWVAGFQTQPSYVESYGISKMIVIQFRTLGAHVFLNQPLKTFTNQYINLDCIFNNEAELVWEELKEAEAVKDKFAIAEKFLYSKLEKNILPNPKLASSLDLLFTNNQNNAIKKICQDQKISRKHLNTLYQEYLGISPKMLSNLNRFQLVLHSIGKSRLEKLTSIAHDLDYFDQAHFNKSFKRFTGIRPTEYIRNFEFQPSLRIVPHFLPAG